MRKNKSKSQLNRSGWLISLVLVVVILVGAGIWLGFQIELTSSDESMQGAVKPSPTSTIEESVKQKLAETADGRLKLYAEEGSDSNGGNSFVFIEGENGKIQTFDWKLNGEANHVNASMHLSDLNQDDVDELVVIRKNLNSSGSTGQEELHVINTKDLTEYKLPSAAEYMKQNIKSQITPLDGYVWIKLTVNEQLYEKIMDAKLMANWGQNVAANDSVTYTVQAQPDRTYVTAEVMVGAGEKQIKLGTVEANYGLSAQGVVLQAIHFNVEPEVEGEIPLHAIQAGGDYVSLRDWDNEKDIAELLGKPIGETHEQLGPDAGTFNGMHVKTLTYDGLELTLYSPKGDRYYVVNMRVTNDRYATSLGIRVGDVAERVEEVYPYVEIALDGRTPPRNFTYAVGEGDYITLFIDLKDGIVNELYFEYLID
ncbi:hypothetical protein RB620_07880 [Paenibacillus sp. LHD-117]|uniref:hypothetical protein n=1 Tax=Paenibacillus sp. LHD-117 TaxID=3071412 RepID=UPI0027DFB7B3|nr:hypothetical protein [Paenibacillus sp. LHD-117]MDQ6419348.1 hypothetical protein [Paenibacillus sp. LHD-117]